MSIRYLEAEQVKLSVAIPQFVEPGHCLWCNKELPKDRRAKKFCPAMKQPGLPYYMVRYDSKCYIHFYYYWYQRPAYQRAVFIRDNFTCKQCGARPLRADKPWLPDLSKLECDHILPLAHGGETVIENLQTLCKDCNRKKGTKLTESMESLRPRVYPLPKKDGALFLSNGSVAWQIHPGRIANFYRDKIYLPPTGWFVVSFKDIVGWKIGEFGELRGAISEENRKVGN